MITPSKREIQKTADAKDGLVGNKTAEKIMTATSVITCDDPSKLTTLVKIDETSIQTIAIPKERYISPKRLQETIDELQLL